VLKASPFQMRWETSAAA